MSRPIRVLHAPAAVGGQAPGLARAERSLGLDSRVVVVDPPPFGYEVDEVLAPPGSSRIRREARRWRLFARALRDFDVVHFNFGSTLAPSYVPVGAALARGNDSPARRLYEAYAHLLELRDLPVLKRAGKAIAVTFQGGDARQRDFSRASFEISYANEASPDLDSGEYDARRRWKIALFDRYADHIYALNPDLLHVLPARAEFLPYASVDLRKWRAVDGPASNPPVVMHAPTDPAIKGTRFVRDAIERLKQEGVPLEYVQVEAVEREEARALFERADIFVDQLLAGWYGGVAVELMALGKPVVCYIRPGDLAFLPPAMRDELPIIVATPATIHEVLREWLTTRHEELREVGLRGRSFVERWHEPLAIAARVKRDYEDALRRARPRARGRSR